MKVSFLNDPEAKRQGHLLNCKNFVLKITISDSLNVFNDSLLSFNEKEMILWNVDRKRILTGAIVRMSHALGKVFAVNAYHIIYKCGSCQVAASPKMQRQPLIDRLNTFSDWFKRGRCDPANRSLSPLTYALSSQRVSLLF